MFEAAKGPFQDALKRAGYDQNLKYIASKGQRTTKRARRRQTFWFNPPFCKSVKSKLGFHFLQLLDRCFPPGHLLHKTLNRHTVQLSYRTLPSFGKLIAGHNAKVTSPSTINLKEENCNCRGKKKTGCVMEGSRCLDKGTVYQAEVTALGKPKEKYVGIASTTWKERYRNHTFTFAHKEKRKNTKLSGYIWQLKEESLDYTIKWRILARCQPFKASTKSCRLCLREKYILMHHPELASLNARDEFFSGCLHKHSLLL